MLTQGQIQMGYLEKHLLSIKPTREEVTAPRYSIPHVLPKSEQKSKHFLPKMKNNLVTSFACDHGLLGLLEN